VTAAPRPATLAIAAGGALGTALRAGLGLALAPFAGVWPWATFAENLLGAFLLAYAFGRADRARGPAWLRHPGFTTGVLGSFTTFSALTVEVSARAPAVGVIYAAATLVGGLALAGLGWRAGRAPGAPS
jgi:CrcB protein